MDRRIEFGNVHRAMLLDELMVAAARHVQAYYDRADFLLARQRKGEDFEPWFEICLPDGTHLRVSVEVSAL